MAAPRKRDTLRGTRGKAAQTHEEGPQRDFTAYKAADTVTASVRLTPSQKRDLEQYAGDRGLKLGQLLRTWILERKRQEGA